jgi:hypothetical protein
MAQAQTWVGLSNPQLTEQMGAYYAELVSQTAHPERIQVIVRNSTKAQALIHRVQTQLGQGVGSLRVETFVGFVARQLGRFWSQVRQAYPQVPPVLDPQVLPKDLTQFLLSRACQTCPRHATVFEKSGLPEFKIWDQLSSAAYIAGASGLDSAQIGCRLTQAWPDQADETKLAYLEAVGCCVEHLRQAALNCGSLDYGTQLALFEQVILPLPEFWQSLDHLLVDQAEDSSGVGLQFYRMAIPKLQSVRFAITLGGGTALTAIPDQVEAFLVNETSLAYLDGSSALTWLGLRLYQTLNENPSPLLQPWQQVYPQTPTAPPELSWIEAETLFEAAEATVDRIQSLLASGTDPAQIAILAPRLEPPLLQLASSHFQDLPVVVITPLPALVKYPLIRALLTLLEWIYRSRIPSLSQVEEMVGHLLHLDPIRAQLLGRDIYQVDSFELRSASSVSEPERVGFAALERYQKLLDWIRSQDPTQPPAQLLSHFAQQPLSLPLHQPSSQRLLRDLIDTAQRFERALPHLPPQTFITMLQSGQTPTRGSWDPDYPTALVMATPIDYLNQGLIAAHQIWFDVSSGAWSRSLWRGLYNAPVLTPAWDGSVWDESHDRKIRRQRLAKTVLSLCSRAHQGITAVRSSYDLRGRDQLGELDRILQRVLKQIQLEDSSDPGLNPP